MVLQTFPDLLGATLSHTQTVLVCEGQSIIALYHLLKFVGTNFAEGALLGCSLAFVDVTTYCATKFFHSLNSLFDLVIVICLLSQICY